MHQLDWQHEALESATVYPGETENAGSVPGSRPTVSRIAAIFLIVRGSITFECECDALE